MRGRLALLSFSGLVSVVEVVVVDFGRGSYREEPNPERKTTIKIWHDALRNQMYEMMI